MSDIFSLKGKSIIVTGATGILGEAFIHAIAKAGGNVGILGRNREVANARAKQINENNGSAIALIADVTNEEQLNAAKETFIAKFGAIDGLVNGAGGNIAEAVVKPDQNIFSVNLKATEDVVKLNMFGTLLPTQVFGKSMEENGGTIVNISSVAAMRALTRVMGYSLAKASIESYTKFMSVELANRFGDKIRMNAIVPGFFLTEQNRTLLIKEDGSYTERAELIMKNTPFRRFGKPEELNGALIWLLSDASKFVTGISVAIDGGFTAFSGV